MLCQDGSRGLHDPGRIGHLVAHDHERGPDLEVIGVDRQVPLQLGPRLRQPVFRHQSIGAVEMAERAKRADLALDPVLGSFDSPSLEIGGK